LVLRYVRPKGQSGGCSHRFCAGLRVRLGITFFVKEPARNVHTSALVVHGRLEDAGTDADRKVEVVAQTSVCDAVVLGPLGITD
jgi:hypothetical protein